MSTTYPPLYRVVLRDEKHTGEVGTLHDSTYDEFGLIYVVQFPGDQACYRRDELAIV